MCYASNVYVTASQEHVEGKYFADYPECRTSDVTCCYCDDATETEPTDSEDTGE